MSKQIFSAKAQRRTIMPLLLVLMLLAGCTSPLDSSNSANPTATNSASSGSTQGTTGAQPQQGGTGANSGSVNETKPLTGQGNGTGTTVSTTSQTFDEQQAIIDVANRARSAVVTVVNKIGRAPGDFAGEALGTGMIVDTEGHIFTNNHVIAGAAPGGLSVILTNGDEVPATLVGADEVSDLAVLKINHPITVTVKLGNSDQLQVGQMVIAIGSALGDFKNTVTVGVVSGLNRTLPGAVGSD